MKKVAIGCGIAALVIVGLGIVATIGGVRWIKGQMGDLEKVDRFTSAMIDEYGTPDEFVPPVDGVYDPQRIELYVDLREELHSRNRTLAAEWEAIVHPTEEKKGLLGKLSGAKKTLGLVRDSLMHLGVADSILVARGMGRGEFLHYDVLALRGWMEVDPDALLRPLESLDPDSDARKAVEELADEIDRESRRWLKEHASNARRIAEREPGAEAWAQYLNDQLARATDERHTIPLTDPLPESLAQLFEEHRDRLSATVPRSIGDWMADGTLILEVEQDENGTGISFKID